MRAATTVKKHAERAAEAEAANIARQEAREHAKQYVAAEDDIFEEYNESVFNGSHWDEEAGERPNKRCRRVAPQEVALISVMALIHSLIPKLQRVRQQTLTVVNMA